MATVNISLPVDGDTIDAADYNTPITTIVNELNGNLSNANIATNAAISGSKLADASITNAKLDTTLASGWVATTSSVSSVTANGNRSYTVVTGSDLSSVVSPGMRLRTTRTVAAPTQSTSLNGSSQYYSKSSPAGMTGTGTFSIMAWVKLSSLTGSAMAVMGRMTATAGTELYVDGTTGQVVLQYRTASNTTDFKSSQSIPLNKWVHLAGVVTSVSGKTGEIYIDGISVPSTSYSSATTSYTQPTADLCVGGRSGGTLFFSGKIAQAAYFSTNISASTIRSYISQGLSGTESSLVSAYSFNNSITDLNTSTANNLTANGSAVATEADSPFGGQADGTISSTKDYAYITGVSGTSLTVTTPTGNTIPTSGGVTSIAYSCQYKPYGFPTTDSDNVTVKSAYNYATYTPTNASQDLASTGLVVGLYVPRTTQVQVTVALGISSTADFEFRPEIRLDGSVKVTFNPAASPGNASSRALVRTFTGTIQVAAGNHNISAGVFLSAGASLSGQASGSHLSVTIPGEGVY